MVSPLTGVKIARMPDPRSFVGLPARAAAATLRPLTGAAAAAVGASLSVERRAIERVLSSPELERLVSDTLNSPVLRSVVSRAVASDSAKQLIAAFFESGLFDQFIDELIASDALWRLVDEVARSEAVTAAITQQGFGFADQIGGAVRLRSRRADDWLERRAHRITGR
jgi:hypothetical protein